MAHQVIRWEANDGSLHKTQREAKRHEAGGEHECPKCKGIGLAEREPIYASEIDSEAMGYLGRFSQPIYKQVITGYKMIECDVCDGKGWTFEKKIPITKTTVVGWE